MDDITNLRSDIISVSSSIINTAHNIHKAIYPQQFSSSYGYIIAYLCDNDDRDIYQRDIERQFSLNRSTVSNILKELEKQGLVERSLVNNDARLKRVTATQGAKMINDVCCKELDSYLSSLAQGIDNQDMECFKRVLEIMSNNAKGIMQQAK